MEPVSFCVISYTVFALFGLEWGGNFLVHSILAAGALLFRFVYRKHNNLHGLKKLPVRPSLVNAIGHFKNGGSIKMKTWPSFV